MSDEVKSEAKGLDNIIAGQIAKVQADTTKQPGPAKADDKAIVADDDKSKDVQLKDDDKKSDDKARTFDKAIAKKHAQYMTEKEKRESIENVLSQNQKENEQLRTAIKSLEAKLNSKKSSDDDEDFENINDKDKISLTKEDIDQIVAEAVAKMSSEREEAAKVKTVQSQYKSMETEFGAILQKAYADRYNSEHDSVDDESMDEIETLIAAFRKDPQLWINRVKDIGVEESVRFLKGIKKPKSNVMDILKAKEAVDSLDADSSKAGVSSSDKPKGLEAHMKTMWAKIKK